MKKTWKRMTAFILVVVMLLGMIPDTAVTAYAEEAAVTEQSADKDEKEISADITMEEEIKEEVTEADTESIDEITEQMTTGEEHNGNSEEVSTEVSTEKENVPEEADISALCDMPETITSLPDISISDDGMEEFEASGSKMIYSDGTWSSGGQSGIIWYVKSGNSKHYVFCLNKGKTMYTGQYSGDITTGYSGKSAFRKAVALHYFYKSNGNSWSGKKNYGAVQEVIWGGSSSDTADKLDTYINHAWKLTSLNPDRKEESNSYSKGILTAIKKSQQESDTDRKKMIAGITNSPIEMTSPDADGTYTKTVSLSGSAWKYFAKGGYSGASSDISVVGIYDNQGKKVSGSASVGTDGKLKVSVKPSTGRGDSADHPLTVIMSVGFDYKGAGSIRYIETGYTKNGGKIQNVTYDTEFNTAGYFAMQVWGQPDRKDAKVYINKVDEYGEFVSGCKFKLTGIGGEALTNKIESEKVINSQSQSFVIEYTGQYRITETAVPEGGEYELNTKPFIFNAALDDENKIVINAVTLPDLTGEEYQYKGDGTAAFTYTCVNLSKSGSAEIVKYGNVLTAYKNGKFVYEKRPLEDVGFSFYAAEDIYLNETLLFKKNQEITDGTRWGKPLGIFINPTAHVVSVTGKEVFEADGLGTAKRHVYTNASGQVKISDLPPGDYYCLESKFLKGFSRVAKKYTFSVRADRTTQINGTSGIINEQASAACYVYKVDNDTSEPLSGGEFTIYANIANTNYDGKPLFSESDTVPVVTKRNLLSGKGTVVKNEWIPIDTAVTSDGTARFEDLPEGKYLVAETKAPAGYSLAEESYEFEHSSDSEEGSNGYHFEHTFKDEKEKSYRILKHAEKAAAVKPEDVNSDVYIYEDEPVAGVIFGIYAAEDIYNTLSEKVADAGTQLGTCTTDEDGIAGYSGHLFAGKYYFKELQTADASRYILDTKEYPFTVSDKADGQLNEHAIVNEQYKGSIKVIKTDGKTKVPLSDVEFKLMDGDNKELGTFVTDKKGEIHIEKLPVGTYYIKETKTKKGYKLDDTVQEVTLSKEELDKVIEFKNYNNETKITVKTDTTIKGGGAVRTGDMSPVGLILALFLLSSAGAVYLGKKKGIRIGNLSAKGKKFILVLALSATAWGMGRMTVKAAAELKEISTVELKDIEHNGIVYTYALQKQYETSDPDEKITFDEKLDGNLKLEDVTCETIDTIFQTKVLEKDKDYKELLEKDESKIPKAINVDGETYNLDGITWEEKPNIEHVSYSQDYGYAASEPEHPATYAYTYTSPVTGKENTVTLPFVRMEKGDYSWVDGFTATVTFQNLDGVYFKLGSHEFAYNADKLSLTESDYKELVKLLGYDTSKYRLNSASWSGKAYKGKNGQMYRDAKASGQQYAASFKAVYEDDVENGKIYTAHAVYTCEVEVPAEEAPPAYVRQATGYYKNASLWTNIITFVTEHKAVPVVSAGIVILFIILATAFFARRRKKLKADENV